MKTTIIDLEDYRSKVNGTISKVFTGRDRGREVRDASRIDDLETSNDRIIVKIPSDIYSINPSFLEEFLYNVVKKLGKEKFLSKFSIEATGEYKFESEFIEAVDRILTTVSAIG